MTRAYISGLGTYVPERVVTNDELAGLMDTTDEWIRTRTGIETRRFAEPGQGPSDLAVPAAEKALEAAGVTVADIDFIIFATSTPDYYAPGSGVLVQHKMGFREIGALDIRVQCCGFVYGLSIAEQYIRTGTFRHILLIGAEVQSTTINLSTAGRDISVLFGDGAGAVVISATEEDRGILSCHLHSQGEYYKEIFVELPTTTKSPRLSSEDLEDDRQWPRMNGREVFRHAVVRFPEVIQEALDANGLTIADITLIVPHQANLRISREVARRMKVAPDLVYSNIHKYGNTTAASIPLALADALEEGLVKSGDYLVLPAFGSGFTWASALIKW
ncbi:MAG: ketoacyl-ACP synthase III [Candidatus Marinimicrobia bacterium]|nr:ketoacyl-ACP synthase III [Candidatus Neomarinimicrobiota bacterium]